ncbi:zinc knuckle [Ostertagia ostertagi]
MSDEEMEQDGEQVGFLSDPRIQSEPPLLSESAAITKACDEALSNNIRNLSGPKRAAILNAVEAAVTAVRDEVERPHSEIRDLKEFLSESGLSVPQLRSVLQEAEINLGLIDTLAGVMKCGRAHLADAVISLQQERDHLTHKVTLLQEQVKRYSQPRATVEERPEEAQGKTFSWRKLSERLISSIEHKDGLNMQVPGESHGKTDGQWKHPSQDLQGGLQDGARKYSLSEKTNWNDSYHMLTALEAPNGMVYQSVRNAALRLERGREALRAKLQSQKGQRQDQIDPSKHRGHGKADTGEVMPGDGTSGKNVPGRKTKCFRCGEMGHYARNCPNANAQVSSPRSRRQTKAEIKRVQMLGMTVDAMIDTGSVVSIVPLGLLLEAKKKMIDLDKLVTIMGDGNSQKVMDASGNTMSFLMLIATEVNVQGAGQACVQLHIQKSNTDADECIFWSSNSRISSGVLKVSHGEALVSVRNSTMEPWVIREGETLGKWGEEEWHDPRTRDLPGDMLELSRNLPRIEANRTGDLLAILNSNHKAGQLPEELATLIAEYEDVFAISDLELTQTDLVHHSIDVGEFYRILGPCSGSGRTANRPRKNRENSRIPAAKKFSATENLPWDDRLLPKIHFSGCRPRFSTGHQNCEPHPRRTNEDPYDLPSLFDYACSWAQAHPWSEDLWKSLPPKKSLVLLPFEFKEHVYSIQSHCQLVHVYSKPDDVQESWCQDEYSAVVLFSPSKAFDSGAWAKAWQLILAMISDGIELFVLGCPRDSRQWPKAIDGLRDMCEETVAQRPKLQSRIKCLLMTKSEETLALHPCNVITENTGMRSYPPSAVKKFYEATRAFCIAHIRLTPYYEIRTKEEAQRNKPCLMKEDNGQEERYYQHGRPPPRFCPKKCGFKKPYFRSHDPPMRYRRPSSGNYRGPNPRNVGERWPHPRKNFYRG